jgi:hypothetical protein
MVALKVGGEGVDMKTALLSLLMLSMATLAKAAEKDTTSANYWLPYCKDAISADDSPQPFSQGVCDDTP